MNVYETKNIRNVAVLGHGGCGKTTLVESLAYITGVISRMGKVTDGNTISDFDKEEIKRQFSLSTAVVPIEANGIKYNFLDTPGYFDFVGEVFSNYYTVQQAKEKRFLDISSCLCAVYSTFFCPAVSCYYNVTASDAL